LVFFLLLTKERPTVRESRLIAKLLEGGKRKILVIRQDRYEVNEEKRVIFLKDWEMEMPFEG
jgi:putative transposase